MTFHFAGTGTPPAASSVSVVVTNGRIASVAVEEYIPRMWLGVQLQAELCSATRGREVPTLCTTKGTGTCGASQGTGHSETQGRGRS